MIQKIINFGGYTFKGTFQEFKHNLKSFKVTKIICQETIQDIEMLDLIGSFRYHSVPYTIQVTKSWTDNILFIKLIKKG